MENKNLEYIGKYISKMYRKKNAFITKELYDIGIGSGQYMFLLEIYNNEGISQEELSEILDIDKGTTARAVKKLEQKELIYRRKCSIDKRIYKLYLTDKGKEYRITILNVLDKWENTMTSKLTEEEMKIIKLLLKKICI